MRRTERLKGLRLPKDSAPVRRLTGYGDGSVGAPLEGALRGLVWNRSVDGGPVRTIRTVR
jgi:hypothetical protein